MWQACGLPAQPAGRSGAGATRAPASRARAAVASVEWSSTTISSSPGRNSSRTDPRKHQQRPASSRAGTITETVVVHGGAGGSGRGLQSSHQPASHPSTNRAVDVGLGRSGTRRVSSVGGVRSMCATSAARPLRRRSAVGTERRVGGEEAGGRPATDARAAGGASTSTDHGRPSTKSTAHSRSSLPITHVLPVAEDASAGSTGSAIDAGTRARTSAAGASTTTTNAVCVHRRGRRTCDQFDGVRAGPDGEAQLPDLDRADTVEAEGLGQWSRLAMDRARCPAPRARTSRTGSTRQARGRRRDRRRSGSS